MILHEGKKITINVGSIKDIIIKDVLGTGGFANVFKIKDISTSKYYVLKHIQLKPTLAPDDKAILVQRIKNEGAVRIPSKYIVPVIGFNEIEKDNFAIIFKYIPNTIEFGDWMLDNKSISAHIKKELFVNILKGINDAHSMNIIHRDLKPHNILITKYNTPKIIDFGLAKFKDTTHTRTGDILGSYPYLDPFVLLKGIKYVDARCDIFAMGVMLHQLHNEGIHYWMTNDNMEFGEFVSLIISGKYNNILDIDKVSMSFKGDSIIKHAISQATMFDPEKRLKTINELIELLGEESVKKIYPKVDFSLSSPVLIVEDGSAKGAMNIIALNNGGKRELNRRNLDITNKSISRKKHAVISRIGDSYYVYDSGGTNGTYVNGIKIKKGEKNKIEIKHTDRIRFADLWTRFVFLRKY